jgi:hypothetical protein
MLRQRCIQRRVVGYPQILAKPDNGSIAHALPSGAQAPPWPRSTGRVLRIKSLLQVSGIVIDHSPGAVIHSHCKSIVIRASL